jgi:hypothetical protein
MSVDTRRDTGLAPRTAIGWAAFAGVISAAVVLGVAELVSLFAGAAGSPLFAVGSLVIDLAPSGVKEFMIAVFGTGDKAALLALMGILIVVISAAAGVLELRRPPFGVIVLGLGGIVALIAVITRAGATGFNGIAAIVGGVTGVVILRLAIERLRRWQRASEQEATAVQRIPGRTTAGPQLERRGFLTLAIVAGPP